MGGNSRQKKQHQEIRRQESIGNHPLLTLNSALSCKNVVFYKVFVAMCSGCGSKYVCFCVHSQRPEETVTNVLLCHSSLFSFEAKFLTEAGTRLVPSMPQQSILLSLPCASAEVICAHASTPYFLKHSGFRVKSSCLHSKCLYLLSHLC